MLSVQIMSCYLLLIIAVIAVRVHTTNGQSYYFSISQNQGNIYSEPIGLRELLRNRSETYDLERRATANNNASRETEADETTINVRHDNTNRTYIVFKNILSRHQTDFSQSTMDVVTVIWYVATFFALAAFFLLMACSDRRRNDSQDNGGNSGSDGPIPPPTPSPSYSEFAPPSYETVMKIQNTDKYSIFVIPFPMEDTSNNNRNKDAETTQTPNVHLHTINELHKYQSGS